MERMNEKVKVNMALRGVNMALCGENMALCGKIPPKGGRPTSSTTPITPSPFKSHESDTGFSNVTVMLFLIVLHSWTIVGSLSRAFVSFCYVVTRTEVTMVTRMKITKGSKGLVRFWKLARLLKVYERGNSTLKNTGGSCGSHRPARSICAVGTWSLDDAMRYRFFTAAIEQAFNGA
jgi:hypothetical protein